MSSASNSLESTMNSELGTVSHEGNALASARWADPEYVARKFRFQDGCIWLGRNPHNPNDAVGYRDDRHVFVCAETGGGKGRAFMVNNQLLWPGSLISIGPKGEEATIAAPRRGPGNTDCKGLQQEVYVLDPMRACNVPKEMRAYFNPLAEMDPSDGELVSKVDQIVSAVFKMPLGAESSDWANTAKQYVATVMLHVVTSEFIHSSNRNLLTVRDLVLEGAVNESKSIQARRIVQRSKEKMGFSNDSPPDPHELLLDLMIMNKSCFGAISRNARDLKGRWMMHRPGFESVRMSASKQLRFLEGEGITQTIVGPEVLGDKAYKRTFKAKDLREGQKPISIFLTLPEQNYDPLDQWLRAMVQILTQAIQAKQGIPECGERILFCIDEFANLGRMDVIANAANSIRGAGAKLMIATQRLGDLQNLYGQAWEKFVTVAGVQVWFNVDELATREYLEKKLGDTEVLKVSRATGTSSGQSTSSATNESYTHTNSLNHSKTSGENSGQSTTKSDSRTRSGGSTHGENWQTGHFSSKSAGRGYGPHLFFEPWKHTSQSGKGFGSSQSNGGITSYTEGWAETSGTTTTSSSGTQSGTTSGTTKSDSEQHGTTNTESKSDGRHDTYTEQFHVRPLLSVADVRRLLLSPTEPDHPAYPGLALVIVAEEEHPFFVRKANHDQDPYFAGKFNPNPAFPYVPLDEQPLFGWQITPDYFHLIAIPEELRGEGLTFRTYVEPGMWVNVGEPIFEIIPPTPDYFIDDARLKECSQCRLSHRVKVSRTFQHDVTIDDTGIIELRFDFPIRRNSAIQSTIFNALWIPWLENQAERRKRRADMEREQIKLQAEEERQRQAIESEERQKRQRSDLLGRLSQERDELQRMQQERIEATSDWAQASRAAFEMHNYYTYGRTRARSERDFQYGKPFILLFWGAILSFIPAFYFTDGPSPVRAFPLIAIVVLYGFYFRFERTVMARIRRADEEEDERLLEKMELARKSRDEAWRRSEDAERHCAEYGVRIRELEAELARLESTTPVVKPLEVDPHSVESWTQKVQRVLR